MRKLTLNPSHLPHFKLESNKFAGRNLRRRNVGLKVDFNVSLKNGRIQNPGKIEVADWTINDLLERGANLVLFTHLGRPQAGCDPNTSLKPVAEFLADKYGRDMVVNGEDLITPDPHRFLQTDQYINGALKAAAKDLGNNGRMLLAPNVRWARYEQEKPEVIEHQELAQEMLGLTGGLVVFDAAAVWNKEHASITSLLRQAGLYNIAWGSHAQKMVTLLVNKFTGEIPRPYVLHISGTKADKMGYILDFLGNVTIDNILVSGNIANGLMQAMGKPVGAAAGTYQEKDLAKAAKVVAHPRFAEVVELPQDFMIAKPDFSDRRYLGKGEPIPEGYRQFDIGNEAAELYAGRLAAAGLAVNSGVPGAFDIKGADPFEEGTRTVLKGLAKAKKSINLGGDGGIAANHYLTPEELEHIEVLVAGGSFLHGMAHRNFPVAEVFLGL
jgi:phosphoglycerate kinase